MTLQTTPTQTALALTLTVVDGSTGLSALVAVRKGTDYLDFSDNAFKGSGWTTRQATMAELGVESPGSYEYALDVSQLGLQGGDNLTAFYEAGTLYASEAISVITNSTLTGDAQTIIDAINAQTATLLAVYDAEGACAQPRSVAPTTYTGHKGDAVAVPVYRGDALMDDTELVGSTSVVMNFENTTTGAAIQVASGVTLASGFATYTTTLGDGVYETAGKWEAQAEGVATTGEPWRSQVITTFVEDEVG